MRKSWCHRIFSYFKTSKKFVVQTVWPIEKLFSNKKYIAMRPSRLDRFWYVPMASFRVKKIPRLCFVSYIIIYLYMSKWRCFSTTFFPSLKITISGLSKRTLPHYLHMNYPKCFSTKNSQSKSYHAWTKLVISSVVPILPSCWHRSYRGYLFNNFFSRSNLPRCLDLNYQGCGA